MLRILKHLEIKSIGNKMGAVENGTHLDTDADADVGTWPTKSAASVFISLMKTSETSGASRRFPGLAPTRWKFRRVSEPKKLSVFFRRIHQRRRRRCRRLNSVSTKVLFYNLHKWYLIRWNDAKKRRDVRLNDVFPTLSSKDSMSRWVDESMCRWVDESTSQVDVGGCQ